MHLPGTPLRPSARSGAKAIAGLCVVGGAAAVMALPSTADPAGDVGVHPVAAVTAAQSATVANRERAVASRGKQRLAFGSPTVTPTASAPAATFGVTGVEAVAKPTPTPTPTTEPSQTSDGAQTSAGSDGSADTPQPGPTSTPASTSDPTQSQTADGSCPASGLTRKARVVCAAVNGLFGIGTIGGYRPGDGDHGEGRAVDVMVRGSRGDAVAAWAIEHMDRYDIDYVIWKQRVWLRGHSSWRQMEDRGSVTANHYDHVHISVQY